MHSHELPEQERNPQPTHSGRREGKVGIFPTTALAAALSVASANAGATEAGHAGLPLRPAESEALHAQKSSVLQYVQKVAEKYAQSDNHLNELYSSLEWRDADSYHRGALILALLTDERFSHLFLPILDALPEYADVPQLAEILSIYAKRTATETRAVVQTHLFDTNRIPAGERMEYVLTVALAVLPQTQREELMNHTLRYVREHRASMPAMTALTLPEIVFEASDMPAEHLTLVRELIGDYSAPNYEGLVRSHAELLAVAVSVRELLATHPDLHAHDQSPLGAQAFRIAQNIQAIHGAVSPEDITPERIADIREIERSLTERYADTSLYEGFTHVLANNEMAVHLPNHSPHVLYDPQTNTAHIHPDAPVRPSFANPRYMESIVEIADNSPVLHKPVAGMYSRIDTFRTLYNEKTTPIQVPLTLEIQAHTATDDPTRFVLAPNEILEMSDIADLLVYRQIARAQQHIEPSPDRIVLGQCKSYDALQYLLSQMRVRAEEANIDLQLPIILASSIPQQDMTYIPGQGTLRASVDLSEALTEDIAQRSAIDDVSPTSNNVNSSGVDRPVYDRLGAFINIPIATTDKPNSQNSYAVFLPYEIDGPQGKYQALVRVR